MGFSSKVKEQTYIASARRCCICKKFAGRNIEVHHMIQKADGGEDSFENAIPLCFDCHAEAGHYNPRHPKGARYAPKELRSHRDAWYKTVKDGNIQIETINVTHQYYLTNSFDIVTEVINGNFENFPLNHIKLVQNDLFNFLKSACSFQSKFAREENIHAYDYKSIDEYKSIHQDAIEIKSEWGITNWVREIKKEELHKYIAPYDFITNYMLKHNAKIKDIAKIRFTEGGCCHSDYEEFILRRAKVIFLAFTNTTNKEILCTSILEEFYNNNNFVEIGTTKQESRNFDLNNVPLASGECLLIPISTVLTPFSDNYTSEKALTIEDLKSGEVLETREININDIENYPTIGPYHKVDTISVINNNLNTACELRSISNINPLLISRYWECGSCPHLFIFLKDKWIYKGELFSNLPDITQTFTIDTNDLRYIGASKIRIIELEKETTIIEHIKLNNKIMYSNIILEKNDTFEFDITGIKKIKIKGKYSLHQNIQYKNSEGIKFQKVFHTISDINREHLTKLCI